MAAYLIKLLNVTNLQRLFEWFIKTAANCLKSRQLCYIASAFILSIYSFNFCLAGDFSDGFGIAKVSYRGIFDKSIYDQSPENLRLIAITGDCELAKRVNTALAKQILLVLSDVDLIDTRAIFLRLT